MKHISISYISQMYHNPICTIQVMIWQCKCNGDDMHVSLLDPKISPLFGNIKNRTNGVSTKSRLRRWRWKHKAHVSHHILMLTLQTILNALNPLLEMLKLWGEDSLIMIHTILNTLKPRSEARLILIHAILHRVEPSITDYNKLLHASA